MGGMLELSEQEFKTPMIDELRALMDKAGGMQEQVGNVIRELKNLRKNQKRNAGDKACCTEMKNASDGCLSRLDTAEDGIPELEAASRESQKTESKENKD